jgi:hypothetical protein
VAKIVYLFLLMVLVLFGVFFYKNLKKPAEEDVPIGREVAHIDKHQEFYFSLARPGVTRELVEKHFPRPSNSDTATIVCWVILRDNESPADIAGKGWEDLTNGRDGYYLIFGRDGKLLDGVNSVSGWPPSEAISHFISSED